MAFTNGANWFRITGWLLYIVTFIELIYWVIVGWWTYNQESARLQSVINGSLHVAVLLLIAYILDRIWDAGDEKVEYGVPHWRIVMIVLPASLFLCFTDIFIALFDQFDNQIKNDGLRDGVQAMSWIQVVVSGLVFIWTVCLSLYVLGYQHVYKKAKKRRERKKSRKTNV